MKPSGRRTALLAVAVVVMVGAVAPVARAATTAIRLSPSVGPPTSMVKVRGKGFGPNEVVDLTFDSTPVGQATTNGAGRFSASITVPASALPRRTHPHRHRAVLRPDCYRAVHRAHRLDQVPFRRSRHRVEPV